MDRKVLMCISSRKLCGFTLIEMLAVIVAIGVLAAIAIPQFIELRDSAEKSTVQSNIKALESAMYIYSANMFVKGKFPEVHNPFDELTSVPINYNGVQYPITASNTPVSTWSYDPHQDWIIYHPKSAIDGGWKKDGVAFIVYQVEVVTEKKDTVGVRISQNPFYHFSWK